MAITLILTAKDTVQTTMHVLIYVPSHQQKARFLISRYINVLYDTPVIDINIYFRFKCTLYSCTCADRNQNGCFDIFSNRYDGFLDFQMF